MISQRISELPRGLRTRFAPSPTGHLHLGHVASAIYVWGLARLVGAEVILRMEDHDQGRCRKSYEESILRDLEWLGFEPDEGVSSLDTSRFRQSDHFERYAKALQFLAKDSYFCGCSRKEILDRNIHSSHASELHYDGHCRSRNEGPNIRLRFDERVVRFDDHFLGLQEQIPSRQCGDVLLKDRDGQWTYNFAVAVDDAEEDIGLIIRGQDILASTGRQIILREKLGDPSSVDYLHHPLIWAEPNKKLSKRDHATSIDQWKQSGLSAEAILGKAAFQVGLMPLESPISVKDIGGLFA